MGGLTWENFEMMDETEKEAYEKRLHEILKWGKVYLDVSLDEENYVEIHASYKSYLDEDEDIPERELIGEAMLYAFIGKDILAADAVSGDVLYTMECASSYDPNMTRLFIVMDHLHFIDAFNSFMFKTDMINKITEVLGYMADSFYFTFMPETLFQGNTEEYQHIMQHFVTEGYQINVGPDQTQSCLGKVIDYV